MTEENRKGRECVWPFAVQQKWVQPYKSTVLSFKNGKHLKVKSKIKKNRKSRRERQGRKCRPLIGESRMKENSSQRWICWRQVFRWKALSLWLVEKKLGEREKLTSGDRGAEGWCRVPEDSGQGPCICTHCPLSGRTMHQKKKKKKSKLLTK